MTLSVGNYISKIAYSANGKSTLITDEAHKIFKVTEIGYIGQKQIIIVEVVE